ncbi:VPA1262 family N-terminal domain-containing protein [Brevifollis gellanilyticus]|uniref:VPA1262 family N-terminal domain-containing protein n=1 Tax=Brevifollis gellanilyticus TaxID=748831 RepID=UPI0011BD87A5|nr:VPA1262 family N-terminal domain-containing protein [Brevifollis gellanilyticus]
MSLDSIAPSYSRAEITTTWLHDRPAKRHILVYCVIELCPQDQELSPSLSTEGHPQWRESLHDDFTLYARRECISVADGISLFRGCKSGQLPFPPRPPIHTMGSLMPFIPQEEPILIPSNLCENAGLGAVLPRRATSLSLLSKYDNTSRLRSYLPKSVSDRIADALQEVLGVDFKRFPEHLGAVHLCFGNPIVKHIQKSIATDGRTLLLRCHLRPGKSISGCSVEFTNQWPPFGQGYCVRHNLQSAYSTVALPAAPYEFRMRFFDSMGRCLENEPGGYFFTEFHMTSSVLTRTKVPHRLATGASKVLEIETATPLEPPSDTIKVATPLEYMMTAVWQREIASLAQAKIFRYFPGGTSSRADALQALREVVGRARTKCTVVDPYLESDDVATLVAFIGYATCELRLLSSNEQLGRRDENDITSESRFMSTLRNLQKHLPFQINARKMLGTVSHDRFLQIDDEVYVVGSSFNHFGHRPTVLFRIQRPEKLHQEINSWWDQSPALSPDSSGRTLRLLTSRLSRYGGSALKTLSQILKLPFTSNLDSP